MTWSVKGDTYTNFAMMDGTCGAPCGKTIPLVSVFFIGHRGQQSKLRWAPIQAACRPTSSTS